MLCCGCWLRRGWRGADNVEGLPARQYSNKKKYIWFCNVSSTATSTCTRRSTVYTWLLLWLRDGVSRQNCEPSEILTGTAVDQVLYVSGHVLARNYGITRVPTTAAARFATRTRTRMRNKYAANTTSSLAVACLQDPLLFV